MKDVLKEICKGFAITLSQLFAEGEDAASLTLEQKEMLNPWSALNLRQQQIVEELLKNM